MRWTLLAVLALATVAAAQPGPAPGYEDGLTYATDYAASQADAAAKDPGGFVGSKSSTQAVAAEADHAAYMACWIADDSVGAPAVCDSFYTRPGIVHPEEEAAEEVEEAAAPVLDPAEDLANETLDIAEDVLADPANAPAALPRIIAALGSFAEALVGLVGDVADGVQDAAAWIAGELGDVADQAGLLGLEAGDLTLDMAGVAGASLADAGDALASTTKSATSGIASAADAAADATASAVSSAADATGDAVSGVAESVAEAAVSIRDTVAQWFGGSAPVRQDTVEAPVAVPTDEKAQGLVDGVLDAVPEL